jgi:hypothetical protein
MASGVRDRLADATTLADLDERVREARRIIDLESDEHAASMRRRAPKVHV